MGFLDALFARSRPVPPNLDVLFAIPPATYTLEAAIGLHPTGVGAVCFKAAEGASGQHSEQEILALLHLEAHITTNLTRDEFGYTWITCRQEIIDIAELVTALHAVNATLSDNGFGASLLCTVIGFSTLDQQPPHRLGLVYLYKRGTVYPFAPTGAQQRDNTLELQVRAALSAELPVESELERWFPLWDAPAP
ncbi:hypothetical protein ABZ942_19580 [Nocardia sp. NPDC046473]|uniref:PspA-associated protein PspAB n=1 Tax=Nocardia sp. NPDC046473 TaxID=3155733 RepID=UPI00340E1790